MSRRKRVKHSVAVVVEDPAEAGTVLIVKRPEGDPDLPGIWGLPAATLRAGESWESAARRAGAEKLGLQLQELRELADGTQERDEYVLHMKLFSARPSGGEPRLVRRRSGVTQYVDWAWAAPERLEAGAHRGSLCCQLYLRTLRRDRNGESG